MTHRSKSRSTSSRLASPQVVTARTVSQGMDFKVSLKKAMLFSVPETIKALSKANRHLPTSSYLH